MVDLFTLGASIEFARKVPDFSIDNLYFLFDLMLDVIFPMDGNTNRECKSRGGQNE